MTAGGTLVALLTIGFSSTFVVGCDGGSAKTGTDAGPVDAATVRPSRDAVSERPVGIRPPLAEARPNCNGSPVLCDRTYDSVAFLATHHSSAVGSAWSAPTQGRSIDDQLSIGGVRAFELEVHSNGGTLAICAGSCAAGNESLLRVLGKFHTFLVNNPGDVVTILVRSRVGADALTTAFDSAGLSSLAHVQARGAAWPTLAQMIAAGHQLVVFADILGGPPAGSDASAGNAADAGAAPPWIHPVGEWMWETSPGVGPDCISASGAPENPFIVVNHYEATDAESDPGVLASHAAERVAARLERCRDDHGRIPTLVMVDFAEIGDPNGGVQIANGVR